MKLPRVFVGTLYSGEGDFNSCCDVIASQQDVEVTHKVITGLSERQAHDVLWDSWRKHQSKHDMFVKVDADTVLKSEYTLFQIYDTIRFHNATGLQAPLHDYMTDGMIYGLNAYASSVVFTETNDDLFCDRDVCVNNDRIVTGADLPLWLRPVGLHCHEATELQAFRFAIHRAMKDQRDEMQALIYAWKRHKDRVRGMGVIGVMIAKRFAEKEGKRSDYNDVDFKIAFNDAQQRYDEYVVAINAGDLSVFD